MATVAQRPPIPAGYNQPKSYSTAPRSRSSSMRSAHAAAGTAANDSQSPQRSLKRRSVTSASAHTHRSQARSSHLRSQYPADSMENHVEYILVASFDIDRGSVMEHQYPGPISGDETMLAELMLPDQTHMRSQDWTIFFLHKDTTAEEEAKEMRRERRRRRRRKELGETDDEEDGEELIRQSMEEEDDDDLGEDTEDEDEDDMEGPPLVYVLNLVYTKHDTSVKRLVLRLRIRIVLLLTAISQRSGRQSYGYLYQTFIFAYLQGIWSSLMETKF